MSKKKNAAAIIRGHLGGIATAAKMTPEQRKQRAKAAALARWKRT